MSTIETTMTPAQCADELETLLNETRQELLESERGYNNMKTQLAAKLRSGSEIKFAQEIVNAAPSAERYISDRLRRPEEVRAKMAAIRSAFESHIASAGMTAAEDVEKNTQNEKHRSAMICLEKVIEGVMKHGANYAGLRREEVETALNALRDR